jgi:hypothetical protein
MNMNSRTSLFAFALTLVMGAVACSSDPQSPAPVEPLVDVPEVPNSVGVDALCDLAAEVRCAGATGCCGSKPAFGSVEECLAAQLACAGQLKTITDNALYGAGTVKYDPAAAGAKLREIAESTSNCLVDAPNFDINEFFVGSLAAGADCSPKDQSGVSRLSCAPGLVCNVVENDSGVATGKCEAVNDSAATNDEFTPAAPVAEDAYCAAPPEMIPPDNADIVPTALSLNSRSGSDSGSTATITLHFIQKGKTTEYFCSIGGIGSDTTKICTSPSTRTWSSAPANDLFYVENDSDDGLQVDSVAVCSAHDGTSCTSTNFTAGTFDSGNTSMLRNKITWAFAAFDDGYGSFWVDANGSGDCTMAKINFNDDNTVTCSDHAH